jgi:hypothetical protein
LEILPGEPSHELSVDGVVSVMIRRRMSDAARQASGAPAGEGAARHPGSDGLRPID